MKASTATMGLGYRHTTVWRGSSRVLVEVETAVRAFPRCQKYTLGGDLQRQALNVCRLVARAGQSRPERERARLLERLSWPVARGACLRRALRGRGQAFCQIVEDGYLRGRMKRRGLRWIYTPTGSGAVAGTTAASPSISAIFKSNRGES